MTMTPTHVWTAFCRVCLCLLVGMGANSAWAHSSSNSYLVLSERGGATVLRADLHLRDIDVVFDLDADRDGQVVWSEVGARSADPAMARRAIAFLASPAAAAAIRKSGLEPA